MSIPLNWLGQRMLKLQGPDRPWTILLRLHLRSPTSLSRVSDAWSTVCAARPELTAILGPDLVWHPQERPTPPAIGSITTVLDHPMIVGTDPAITVVVDNDPATTVSISMNHAFADGIGGRGIADDFLRALDGVDIAPRTPVSDQHLDRMRTRRPALAAAAHQIPPWPLATSDAPLATTTSLETVVLDRGRLDAVRNATGVSVGAVLIEAAHRALREADDLSMGTVAVGVPADLRRHIGHPDGIGNAVVNLTYASSTATTVEQVDRFLNRHASAKRLGGIATWIYRATRPGLPRTTPRSGRAVATATLSSMGLVDRGDHWRLASGFDVGAPAHQTPSLCVVGFGTDLRITIRSRSRADGLTDRFVSALGG